MVREPLFEDVEKLYNEAIYQENGDLLLQYKDLFLEKSLAPPYSEHSVCKAYNSEGDLVDTVVVESFDSPVLLEERLEEMLE